MDYEEISGLKKLIRSALDLSGNSYESRETKNLNAALADAHREYTPIFSNRVNNYYKSIYCDLEVIMSMVRPVLSKHGLTITQRTIQDVRGIDILQTRLWHATGEWIESRSKIIPSKNEIRYAIGDYSGIAEDIMDSLRLRSLSEIPKDEYENSIKRVRKIVNLRKGRA